MKESIQNNIKNFIESLEQNNSGQALECVKFLGNEINSAIDDYGNTPLHFAVKFENPDLIKLIFERMIEQKITYSIHNLPKNKLGRTALHSAVIDGSPILQYSFAPFLLKDKYPEIFSYVIKQINKNGNQASLVSLCSKSLRNPGKWWRLFKEILDIAPLFLNNPNKKGVNILQFTMNNS